MTLYKFVVPTDRFYPLPDDPDTSFRGCVAVALAPDAPTAQTVIASDCIAAGVDPRWLEVAQVTVISIDTTTPTLVALALI